MSRPRASELPGEQSHVVFLRDPAGTWLGVEVVRTRAWSPSRAEVLSTLPDPERADMRLVLIESPRIRGPLPPAWVV